MPGRGGVSYAGEVTSTTARPAAGSGVPALTWWSSLWRYGLAVLVGLFFWGMDVVLLMETGAADWHGAVALIGLPLGMVSIVLLRWRRRFPLAIALALGLISGVAPAASGASLISMVSLGTRRRWQDVPPVLIAGLAGSFAYDRSPLAVEQTPALLLIAFVTLFTGIVIATGWYIGARRDLITTLRERAETAEREQSLRADQARANERAAIAREMHDVLAHRISLIAMHAGALTYRRDLTPEQSAQAAHVIETAAHEALRDLRDVLGVLRATPRTQDDRADDGHRPQPTLADLDALIDQERAAGTRLEAIIDLPATSQTPQPPPQAMGRHAYRIVQEALTNARKHATQAPVTLRVQGRPGSELVVRVSNPIAESHLALPGAGSGLTGLAERAELAGGRLESGRRGRLFVVQAWLPWPVGDAGIDPDRTTDAPADTADHGSAADHGAALDHGAAVTTAARRTADPQTDPCPEPMETR